MYKTTAPFVVNRRWVWVTWTHADPNACGAVLAKAKELGATGWDFGQVDHYEHDRYPHSR